MQLTIEQVAPYLPFKLKVKSQGFIARQTLTGIDDRTMYFEKGFTSISMCQPYLRSLSHLTQEIEHNGERFVFTSLFEMGDEGGYNYEFDFGNTKLIRQLTSISIHNNYHDIAYLPFQVVKEMHKYHFDTMGLLEQGLALPIQ